MDKCKLFDRYRDNEMSESERSDFELHLAACRNCREKMALLGNIVGLIKQEPIRPLDLAEQIAEKAFGQPRSWDTWVLSWLKPSQALAALVIALIFISLFWFLPGPQKVSVFWEYEQLMNQADAAIPAARLLQAGSDSEFMVWLQQEGNPQ